MKIKISFLVIASVLVTLDPTLLRPRKTRSEGLSSVYPL